MLNNLLFNLGLRKIPKEKSREFLFELHNHVANLIVEDELLDNDRISEHRAEIKMFFWFLGGLPLHIKFQRSIFFDVVHNEILTVLFQEIISDSRKGKLFITDEDMNCIYRLRNDFYKEFQSNKDGFRIQGFLRKINKYLFESPFHEYYTNKKHENKDEIIDFSGELLGGVEPYLIKPVYINELIKNMLPMYIKSIKKLYKFTGE